jgi:hypothetical protein
MRRKTFDMIVTAGGAGLVVVLLAAGALGLWGYSYANSNVHNQLVSQQIFFPARAAFAHAKVGTEIEPVMIPYIEKYAGEQLLTGAQAEAYADHFIYYHLQEIGGGKSYAQLSSAAMALPKGSAAYTKAEAVVQTMFQGTTLRGLLLEAYAFWTIGQVSLWGAIIAFILAGVMALLTALGLWHTRRTPDEEQFPKAQRNGRAEKVEQTELAKV